MTKKNREASCQGKSKFDSFRKAEAAAKRNPEWRRSPYHCTFCNCFHLGGEFLKKRRKPRLESFA